MHRIASKLGEKWPKFGPQFILGVTLSEKFSDLISTLLVALHSKIFLVMCRMCSLKHSFIFVFNVKSESADKEIQFT